MGTSEEWPRTLSRWSEKHFKKVFEIDKPTFERIRNKAAEVFLDDAGELSSLRVDDEMPKNFAGAAGKKYLDACASRLEELLQGEGHDYRSESPAHDQCDTAFKAFIVTAVNKRKQRTKSSATPQKKGKGTKGDDSDEDDAGAGEEDDDDDDDENGAPAPVRPPPAAKKAVQKSPAATKSASDQKMAPAASSVGSAKTSAARKATATPKTSTAAKPASSSESSEESSDDGDTAMMDSDLQAGAPRGSSCDSSNQSAQGDSEVVEAVEKAPGSTTATSMPASVVPAKRQRIDTPLCGLPAEPLIMSGTGLTRSALSGMPPNKIRRLSHAVMEAQTAIGTQSVQDLIACADVGTRYVPPDALDTLTDTLLTVVNICNKQNNSDTFGGNAGVQTGKVGSDEKQLVFDAASARGDTGLATEPAVEGPEVTEKTVGVSAESSAEANDGGHTKQRSIGTTLGPSSDKADVAEPMK